MFKGCQWLQTTPNTNGVNSKKSISRLTKNTTCTGINRTIHVSRSFHNALLQQQLKCKSEQRCF